MRNERTTIILALAWSALASGCGDESTSPRTELVVQGPFAYQVGGPGEEFLGGVALTPAGQRIFACQFQGTAFHRDLGDSASVDTLVADGQPDVLVSAYGPSGDPLWSSSVGGSGEQRVRAVAAGSSGDVYVTGQYLGDTRIAGSDRDGSHQTYVAAFDSDGQPLWGFNTTGSSSAEPGDLAADDEGNVVLAGTFLASVDLGAFHGDATSGLTTGHGGFVTKIDATGQPVWATFARASSRFGAPFASFAGADVSHGGNVYACGEFQESVSMGTSFAFSDPTRHAFLVKLAADGTLQWLRAAEAKEGGFSGSVDLATAGEHVFLAGAMIDSVRFGGVSLFARGLSHFIACYDEAGTCQWATLIGDDQTFLSQVARVNDTEVAVTATFSGTVELGGRTLQSAGDTDLVTFHVDASGQITQAERFGGLGGDSRLLVASRDGVVLFGGMTFSDLPLTPGLSLRGEGRRDVFVYQR
jgi:hypothetical protein